ncbi:MAG: hypothetical protein OXD49_22295 [Candidatus Poribacteria bacterium]|nr:hypothetical protein [Candidatus Poribacteria bacterium]
MIRLKNSIYSTFAFALLPFVMLGCLSMAAQNTVRVDNGMTETFEMSESGTGVIQKWILPERRSISRIEIHFDPIEPLRNMTVYARMGEDNWRIVKAIKTPIRTSPYIIRAPLSTDAIRVVLSSSIGMIDRIVLYGAESSTSTE